MTRLVYLSVFAFVIGCGGPAVTPPMSKAKPVAKEHVHPEGGPSGGVLASWGQEEYHAEFTVDHATGEVIVYMLDGTATRVTPIDAPTITLSLKETPPVVVPLNAKPQDGDPPGQASRFVGQHDALKVVKPFRGSISGKAGGKNYSGDFEEKPAGKK